MKNKLPLLAIAPFLFLGCSTITHRAIDVNEETVLVTGVDKDKAENLIRAVPNHYVLGAVWGVDFEDWESRNQAIVTQTFYNSGMFVGTSQYDVSYRIEYRDDRLYASYNHSYNLGYDEEEGQIHNAYYEKLEELREAIARANH